MANLQVVACGSPMRFEEFIHMSPDWQQAVWDYVKAERLNAGIFLFVAFVYNADNSLRSGLSGTSFSFAPKDKMKQPSGATATVLRLKETSFLSIPKGAKTGAYSILVGMTPGGSGPLWWFDLEVRTGPHDGKTFVKV